MWEGPERSLELLQQRELELNRKHEELLLRREALLRGTEAYYDAADSRGASFISDYAKATERNECLLKDITEFHELFKTGVISPGSNKFQTMKKNYWTMVKHVFPVWHDEFKDYEKTLPKSERTPSVTAEDTRTAQTPSSRRHHRRSGRAKQTTRCRTKNSAVVFSGQKSEVNDVKRQNPDVTTSVDSYVNLANSRGSKLYHNTRQGYQSDGHYSRDTSPAGVVNQTAQYESIPGEQSTPSPIAPPRRRKGRGKPTQPRSQSLPYEL